MSEQNQEIIQSPGANLPPKRKRGRPRKLQSATSSQPYPAPNSNHGVQVIPNQVDLAAFSGMGPQTLQFHTPSKLGVDPTAISRSASLEVSPSQKTHGLLGQTVSGTLDGTFEAGYLLTVKVGDTGHVLKGIVFDPHRCVPISEQNDIAPSIPMARPMGTSYSPTEKPSQALVSVPVGPAATSSFDVAVPRQRNESPSNLISEDPLLTVAKLPQSVNYKPSAPDIKETLPKVAELIPNAAVGESQAEDSLSPFITNKEEPQVTAVVNSEVQRGIVIEPHTVAESSANIDMAGISGLDQRQQHHSEELLQGNMPQSSEQSSDKGQFCGDPKLQDEIWNL